jgi:hypothetical protein
MKWVTREFVHVDRTACPWLIKRFVDPNAEFIFLPPDKIEECVKREGAIPFDLPNAELGHHGDRCSFDAVVEKYGISDTAVKELAVIVRSADTGASATVPEAAGLDAIMTGISMNSSDDHEAVRRASVVYDALYTICKIRQIRERHSDELERMDRKERRPFLKAKLAKW